MLTQALVGMTRRWSLQWPLEGLQVSAGLVYEVCKDAASSRSYANFWNAEAAGDVKRSAGGVSVISS